MNDNSAELAKALRSADEAAHEERPPENLKPDINEFLWARLPGFVTLDRAEELSVQIFDLIVAAWESKPAGVPRDPWEPVR